MASDKGDLLFHPVRMRVILALARGRQMTAQQLGEALADVSQPTLYRHLNRLLKGGLLRVVEERPVRGTVERVYALPAVPVVNLDAQDLAQASRDDLMRYFTSFVGTLLSEFGRYLDREHVDLQRDGVGMHQLLFYLSDEEFVAFTAALRQVIRSAIARGPGPGRTLRAFTTVLLPAEEPPAGATGSAEQGEPAE